MSKQRPTIAFLSDFYLGDYQTTLHNAIESAARAYDMNLLCIIGRSVDTPLEADRAHNKIYSDITPGAVSGIIFLGTSLSHFCGTQKILSFCRGFDPIPMCNIGLSLPGIPSIMVDNRPFGEIPGHLIDVHQCRRLAFLGGPPTNEESRTRRSVFLEALETRGVSFDTALETSGLFTVQSGFEATNVLLEKKKPFDALVAANDEMAVGALFALKKHGITVGEEVRLMGFDDIPLARFSNPKLSTMRTPLAEMGQRAVELLHKRIRGESVASLTESSPVLVCRESCGCADFAGVSDYPGPAIAGSTDIALEEADEKPSLKRLLAAQIHIPDLTCPDWASRLVDAVFDELSGHEGRFIGTLTEILEAADQPLLIADELQNCVTLLRERFQQTPHQSTALDDLWDKARKKLFSIALHRQMARMTATDTTNRLFARRTREALPPTLSREALADAVTLELQSMSIENGAISVYTSDKKDELECVVAFSDGLALAAADSVKYPSTTFVPTFLSDAARTSYVVLVLSSGSECLGVLTLELGGSEFYYEMCREHVSAYLKNVAFHQAQVKQLQEATDQTRRELELQHRQKLESLGVLAGGIAHDFNNMLSAILGNLEVAMMDIEAATPSTEPIVECKSVVKHAAGLCRQLLAYSGKGKFVIRPIDINNLLGDLKDFLKMAVPKSVSLVYELGVRLPAIEGDVSQLNQVFVNLVINAAEAIGEEGGSVTLKTAYRACEAAHLTDVFSGDPLPSGAYVVATVDDTGCGMEKAVVERIFDPFFTTKFTGRGLGLAAVLGIVRGHRGGIRVVSRPGSGTSFEVFLPTLPKVSATPKRSTVPPPWRGEGTILVADDEPTLVRVAERLLTRIGFSVITAADGQEAVDAFQDIAGDVDCVILDISMPGLGGVSAMKAIRQIRPEIPVILTSGYSEKEAIASTDNQAPEAFIQKPYDAKTLRHALQRILRQNRKK
jgi:DNA-binding LacI/PurR family transcriptional regulator/signal transduction histidine kinase/ActR/RegA family two-component response regulator